MGLPESLSEKSYLKTASWHKKNVELWDAKSFGQLSPLEFHTIPLADFDILSV
jgi:hypothetical protein